MASVLSPCFRYARGEGQGNGQPPKKETGNPEWGSGSRGDRAALITWSELAGLKEAGDQRDLALGFIFCNPCHFLLSRRFQELPSIGVSGGPDLREKIAVAVTVEDQF